MQLSSAVAEAPRATGPMAAAPSGARSPLAGLRVALIHDWVVTVSGAEFVVDHMLRVLPQADVFSTVDFLAPDKRGWLHGRPVRTTFVQRLPRARDKYRSYLPLMPLAIEQHDLSGYDLIVSSSHAVAKGVLTGPDQLHVCMCYSPIRYAWDLQHQYLREAGLDRGVKGWLARWILHRIRIWDARTANGVDHFIGISEFIRRRIRKAYGRDASVIYPPVEVEAFTPGGEREDFYVTASRFVPYKRIDLVVEAFSRSPGRRLVVIGDGPEFERVRRLAGPNVSLLGYQPREVLLDHLRRARAFVFAAEEDFGIAPVEAQACGTPVIAFGRGGTTETVRGLSDEAPTGVFFGEQTVDSLLDAVDRFEREGHRIAAAECRANAMRFNPERFRDEFESLLVELVERTGLARARHG